MSIGNTPYSGQGTTNTPYQKAMVDLMRIQLERLTARGGSEVISDTTLHIGKNYYAFVPEADSVISVLSGGIPQDTTTDLLGIMGLTGHVLKARILYVIPMDMLATNIQLMSGSINFYKIK